MSSNDSTSDPSPSPSTPGSDESSQKTDRTALIQKAQAFLLSPSIRHADGASKRKFLHEKGLTQEEVDVLMHGLPREPPPIPPRTYPPPPPSQLPGLLASLFRVFMWVSGVSTIVLWGYFRFLLPRISRTLGARHKLMLHHSELIVRLKSRINEVKKAQEEEEADAPFPLRERELDVPLKGINNLTELPVDDNGHPTHSIEVMIYYVLLEKPDQRFTVEDVYQRLSKQFPGLTGNGHDLEASISRDLSWSRLFHRSQDGNLESWTLSRDAGLDLASPVPLKQSLEGLRDALSQGYRERNKYDYTFKALTDLTGFLSRETFALYGAGSGFRHGLLGGRPLAPAEEDVRREIRALKGLVLNRRSFVSSPNRQSTATPEAA